MDTEKRAKRTAVFLTVACGTVLFLVFGFMMKVNNKLAMELEATKSALEVTRDDARRALKNCHDIGNASLKKCYESAKVERAVWKDASIEAVEKTLEIKDNRRRR